MKPLLTLAAAAAALLAAAAPALAAAPADDLRAAVAAGGTEVAAAEPQAFLAAVSAVLAGVPAAQVPAYAGAAVSLRADLAGEIVHAAISALHMPGRLPEAGLVAATVRAALAAAPAQKDVIVARAVVDAPEARDFIFAAAGVHAVDPAVTVARLGALPSSQARLSDLSGATAAAGSAATNAAMLAPSTPVADGTLNPANSPSPRRRLPNTSAF